MPVATPIPFTVTRTFGTAGKGPYAVHGLTFKETGGTAAVTVVVTDEHGTLLGAGTAAAGGVFDIDYGRGRAGDGLITITVSGTGAASGSLLIA